MKTPFKTKAEVHAKVSNGYIEELTVGIVSHFVSCIERTLKKARVNND